MERKFTLLVTGLFITGTVLFGQLPEMFNYQAVVRNVSGNVLANQSVTVKFGILQGSETGTLIWEEQLSTTTNAQGLFTLRLGNPASTKTGGTLATFGDISWLSGIYFLKVQANTGSGFQDMGTTAFAPVPWALVAQDVVNKDDADASPTNEIQNLTLTGASLGITGGTGVTLPDASATNEIQNITLTGANLGITGGTGITLPDASSTNELNSSVTFSGNILTITDAGGAKTANLSTLADYWLKDADSLHYLAGNVGIGTSATKSRLSVMGYALEPEEPLFEVKRKDGQTVFAVFNEGVRVYVEDAPGKGSKGGFAVGGFDASKGITQEYMRITPDSVRIYVDAANPGKGPKGGFAVGGFDASKAPGYEYLRVTHDSVRVYVNDPLGKGSKGGFAVGGYDATKGSATNFLDLTPNNYFIGHQAGISTTSGLYNSFVGYQSGLNNTEGANNSFMGYQAGLGNTTGSSNTFVGNSSGSANTTGASNTFVGTLTGRNFTTGNGNTFMGVNAGGNFLNGDFNVFIGSLAGYGLEFPVGQNGGDYNVAIGTGSGYRLSTGMTNVFLGNFAGVFNTAGSHNVFMGFQSGYLNSTGNYNSFIGYQSGLNNSTGSSNVFMGYQAGLLNTIGYNNVFLGNNSGNSNTEGFYNTFIGNLAGYSNTTGFMNIFIGNEAGKSNTTANRNVIIGPLAGRNNSTGDANTFLGQQAGEANSTGSFNTFLGRNAGNFNTTGLLNTFLGVNTGNANTTGQENVALGGEAAKWNSTGSYNVSVGTGAAFNNLSGSLNTMVGYYSGISLTGGSNNIFIGPYAGGGLSNTSGKLFIENSSADATQALIYGDFATDYLRLNANVDIRNSLSFPNSGAVLWVGGKEALWYGSGYFSWGFGTGAASVYNYFGNKVTIGNTANPSYMLYVQGQGGASGGWVTTSDQRYKTNVRKLGKVLPGLESISSVYYDWDKESYPDMNFSEETQIGFLAQEVESVFPEMVSTDQNGYKALDYSKMTVVLLQAIKEQQEIIESQGKRIRALELKINEK